MTARKVTLHLGPYDGATTLATGPEVIVNGERYVDCGGNQFKHVPKTK